MPAYDEIVEALQTLCEIPLNNSDADFQRILPRTFENADNRIYRELDLLATNISSSGAAFTAGNGRLSVPTGFVGVQYVNLLTPGATSGDAATRTPLERVSNDFLDFAYPTNTTSGTALPSKYALIGDTSGGAFSSTGAFTMRVAPAPATAFVAEFIGPVRPPVLSALNPNTILTTRYPDLYIAACMSFLMGYQRDFGAQASDPAAAMTWERTYTSLREGVMVEIERQKSQSVGWSTRTPSVLANQPRDRMPSGGPVR